MRTIPNWTSLAHRLAVATALAVAVVAPLPGVRADDAPKPAVKGGTDLKALAKARLEASHAAFDEALRAYGQTRRSDTNLVSVTTAEQVYSWSVRWLEAQRAASRENAENVKALKDHVNRMKDLQQRAEKMHTSGLVPRLEVAGTQFYLTEAELWLAQTKTK